MIIQETAVRSFASPVFDLLQDAMMWVLPVHGSNDTINDFEIAYINKAATELLGLNEAIQNGLYIQRNKIPSPPAASEYFLRCLDAYHSGQVRTFTCSIKHDLDRYLASCIKFEDGVLITIRDRRAEQEAERKEEENRLLLNGIIAHARVGIVAYEAVRDSSGNILDFRVKHYNEFVHTLTGIPEEERKQRSLRELMISLGNEKQYELYLETVETGKPFSSEFYNIRRKAWFQVSVVKLGDGFLTILSDISELKQSQQQLEKQSLFANSILNASLNGIYVLEAVRNNEGDVVDFIFVQGNKKFTELTGSPIEELLGNSFLKNFSHTKETGLFQALVDVVKTGLPHHHTAYYAPAFHRWYNVIAVRLETNCTVVTFQEITQQREATLQIEKQKNLLDNILSNSPNGIMVYEAVRDQSGSIYDFRCIVVNQAAEEFSQIKNELRISKTVLEITPHFKETSFFHSALAAIEKKGSFRVEHYSQKVNKWLELSFSRMDDNHLINVITDISHIKAAQQEMERLIDELKRSNKSLEEFAYAASHDLQEPLRKIHTFSDRLKHELSPQLNENQQRLFTRIEGTTQRMRNLIEDLLTYSQISTGSNLHSTVNLNIVLQKVINNLEPSISDSGARIQVEELPQINGSEEQLFQLFMNLVSNAIKYGKKGQPPVIDIHSRKVSATEWAEEELQLSKSDFYYVITVKDNGIGFDQKHADKIFQVFQRLHGQSQFEGTGVGLAIVQKVVENHKGYIRAESSEDSGALFTIILPC